MVYLDGAVTKEHPLWSAVKRATLGSGVEIEAEIEHGYFVWVDGEEPGTVATVWRHDHKIPAVDIYSPHVSEVLAHYGAYGLLLWTEEVVKHEILHVLLDTPHHSGAWKTVGELGVVYSADGNATHLERIKAMEDFYANDLQIEVPYGSEQLDEFYTQAAAYERRAKAAIQLGERE
jgi:hypothetical protein